MFLFQQWDPNNLPEDMPQEMKDQIHKQQLENSQAQHDLGGFFESLNEDQITSMRRFLNMLSHVENPMPSITYYLGLAWTLQTKFGYCLSCGEKHDEQAAAMAVQAAETTEAATPVEEFKADSDPYATDASLPWADYVASLSSDYLKALSTWEVTLVAFDPPKVKCVNCETIYLSLQDRMLRKPGKGGCENCIQKEKWG